MTVQAILRNGLKVAYAATDQVFSFTPLGGEELMLLVPRLAQLRRWTPEHWETIEVPIAVADALRIIETRGIGFGVIRRMTDSRAGEPGYGVFMPDGSFLIVDGNHRFVRRAERGDTSMTFHVCRPPHWNGAVIDQDATRRLLQGGTP